MTARGYGRPGGARPLPPDGYGDRSFAIICRRPL